jgi:hypothetical protein
MPFLDCRRLGADKAGANLENAREGRGECLSPLRQLFSILLKWGTQLLD